MVTIATLAAWLGCAFLLVVWLTVGRRKLIGFFYTCVGWVTIILCVRSDQKQATLIGIVIACAVVSALLLAGYATLKSRRVARRRQVVYYPGQAIARRVK